MENYSLAAVVREIVESRRELPASTRGQTDIRLNIESDLDSGKLDSSLEKGELMQIVDELLHNSFKAYGRKEGMYPVGGPIDVRLYRSASYCILEVEDYGEGISPEILSKIKKGECAKSGFGSVGYGLKLVKNFCRDAGVDFSIHTKEGSGTKVKISFYIKPNSPKSS